MSDAARRNRSLTGGLLLLALTLYQPALAQQAPPGPAETPGQPDQPGQPGQPLVPPGRPLTAPGQQPLAPGQLPVAPGAPPGAVLAPVTAPVAPGLPPPSVPVIPDVQLIPSPNVPSAPVRVLPAPAFRTVPSARFELKPSVLISEEYTDNFNLTERDREENFRSTVAPGLELDINTAFVEGVIAYRFSPSYDTATKDFSFFHSLLGQVAWDVTPLWTLTLADTFTRSDQPGEADRLALRQERQKFTSNTVSLASDYLIDRVETRQSYQMTLFSEDEGRETKSHIFGLSATVPLYVSNAVSGGYEYLISNTTGDVEDATTTLGTSIDEEITGHRFTAGVQRRLHAFQLVGLTGSYALRTVTSDPGDETDFRLWNGSAFTDYELPGRLRLNLMLGVSALSADSGESVGPNLSTRSSLSYQFGPALVTLAADKGFAETFAEGENFGVVETEGVSLSLFYPFTPLLSATVTGSYRHNKPTDVGVDIATTRSTGSETETWGGAILVRWNVTTGVVAELSYGYTKQVGFGQRQGAGAGLFGQLGSDDSYTENRVRAAINLSF
jgi:hypothetical protein